jgi:hypothetical protein
MPVSDWSLLLARVGDILNRTDIAPHFPAAVAMTESRLRRLLRSRTVGPVAITLAGATAPLPADCDIVRSLTIPSGPFARSLTITTPSRLAEIRGAEADAPGFPLVAAVIDGVLHLAPTPNQAYAAQLTYYRTVPSLTATGPTATNWLLQSAPDVYVYGVLAELHDYLMDPEAQARSDARFRQAVAELNVQLGRIEYGAVPLGDGAQPEYVF